jgi:hypothetical protein
MPTVIGNKSGWIAALTLLVCLLLVASAAGVAVAAPAYVSVTSATISEDEPETGDTIIVTPTIRHSGSGSGSLEVTEVTLIDETGERHADIDDLGVLGAGDTIDVPLSASFDTAGDKRLTVHVRGKQYDADGKFVRVVHVTHPAYVSVSAPSTSTSTPPQVQIEAGRAVAGAETSVAVTVSNGGDEKLTDLSLRLEGLDGGIESKTALSPKLAAGNSTTFRFDVRPVESGEQTLKATLRYGDGNSVEAFDVVDVEPLRDEVSVHATVVEENESLVLNYRVTNHGNAPIEDVTLSGETANGSLPRATIATVGAATSETVTVELASQPTGTATVTAAYDVGETTGQVGQSIRFDADSGASVTAGDESTDVESPSDTSLFGTSTFMTGILTGGVVVAGTLFGYRGWRNRGGR